MFEAKSIKVEFGVAAAAVAVVVVVVLAAAEVVLLLLLPSVREIAVVVGILLFLLFLLLLSSIPNADGNSGSSCGDGAVNNARAANESVTAVLVKERCGWFL